MKTKLIVYFFALIFFSTQAKADFLYHYQVVDSSIFPISWEYLSNSIFITDTEIEGSLLFNVSMPSGYDITTIQIIPIGPTSWVTTYWDTDNDGKWNFGYGTGFDRNLTNTGLFTRSHDGTYLQITSTAVPEPTTALLFCIGLIGFAVVGRKIKN